MLQKHYKIGCIFVVIFLLIVVIAYLNPMQSDDFAFYFKGLAVSEHVSFYMNWSGRVVVDWLSTVILSINNHLLIAAISSLAVPLLIYNVATIVYYKEDQVVNKPLLAMTVVMLFVCYWLTNPALGQTTFWVVGEANYLWPLVFVAAYFKYLLRYLGREQVTTRQYLLIILLSVLSGCSNEATGALVLYVLVLLFVFAWLNNLSQKRLVMVGFCVAFISFLVLLLAPGNMVRAASSEYASWRSMALGDRIYNHFLVTIPLILKGYGIIYLVLLWAFAQAKHTLSKMDGQLVVIFGSAAVVFCVILIASPHATVPRSQLTGLFFLLVVLSFLLKESFHQAISLLGKLLLVGLCAFFMVSYGYVLRAYYSIYQQSEVRLAIINQQKQQGQEEITIPNYYKPFVLRAGDYPELDYHDAVMMGKYYGVRAIKLVFVDFNYERILNKPCEVAYARFSQSPSVLQCVYVDKQFWATEVKFIVKFNPAVAKIKHYQTHFKLQITNTFNKADERYYQVSLPLRIIKIGDDFFASVNVLSNLLAIKDQPKLMLKVEGPVKLADGSSSVKFLIVVE